MTHQHTQQEIDPRQARREEATARHALHVAALLDRREELQGVLGLADLVHDSVRWAA
jgi:hypothetical protein